LGQTRELPAYLTEQKMNAYQQSARKRAQATRHLCNFDTDNAKMCEKNNDNQLNMNGKTLYL